MQNNIIDKTISYIKNRLWPKIVITLGLVLVLLFIIFMVIINNFIRTGNSDKNTQSFTVVNGQGLRAISSNLKKEKIISSDVLFVIYMKYSGLSGTIQAGDYVLSPAMPPMEIADILSKGRVASRKITIPEGWTISEIGNYLEKQGVAKKVDFMAAASNKYDYDFLSGKPADVNLEGFLFPDTYQISVTANAESIIKTMLDNFDKRVGADIRSAAKNTNFSLYQVVTLASVVEMEANKPADRKVVAGVFISRLNEGMRLQSDVTVTYALGGEKKELTAEDIQYASPYNTYTSDGLPKGPICNPGLESINAVIYPEMTDFRYFIAADDQVYYAKTLEDHNINVSKYLR